VAWIINDRYVQLLEGARDLKAVTTYRIDSFSTKYPLISLIT
jgi:hypothetical protein